MKRRLFPIAPLPALVVMLTAVAAAAPFGKGPLDHSLCCPTRGPNPPGEFGDDWRGELFPGASDASDSALGPRHERRAPASVRTPPPTPGHTSATTATLPISPAGPAAPATATPVAPAIVRLPGPPLAALDGPLETMSGYAKIAFSQLAGFTFAAPAQPVTAGTTPPDVLAQVPPAIKRLDGKKVVLTGFMLPTKLENGFATEFFFLSSSQLCCFGVTPAVNEWMLVKMRKEGLPAVQDVPVSLAGRLRVRAQWDGGYLTSLYELEGDGLLKTKP